MLNVTLRPDGAGKTFAIPVKIDAAEVFSAEERTRAVVHQPQHKVDVNRVNLIPIVTTTPFVQRVTHAIATRMDGWPYPKLVDDKFVPMRKIVHLDLKGGAFKPSFFPGLFKFLQTLNVTGILLEWEDMFPYEGVLAEAQNKNAYSRQEVTDILYAAHDLRLEVIPLVQTLGHLEWVLKLDKFRHLRDDPTYSQVICVGKQEAWELLKSMIEQVLDTHAAHSDMRFFHIGADEAFQFGVCNETAATLATEGGKERVMIKHIARVAQFVKDQWRAQGTRRKGSADKELHVLAWHDMLVQAAPADLIAEKLTELVEPVLWNYAEDLDMYLLPATWLQLQPFPKVWVSSAFKGADGPMRYHSNPRHYVRNHESWLVQLQRVWRNFEAVQGIIVTGWSRYDHLAALCELLPVGLPALALSLETLEAGDSLNGIFPTTMRQFGCMPPLDSGSYVLGCQMPGRRVYELTNELYVHIEAFRRYRETDYELNGWLSPMAQKYAYGSAWYAQKILPLVEYYGLPIERIVGDLKREMEPIYFQETIDEFLLTYVEPTLGELRRLAETARTILAKESFPRRPFVESDRTENTFLRGLQFAEVAAAQQPADVAAAAAAAAVEVAAQPAVPGNR